ncbi:MAG: hypothetical protein AAB673_02435 [Patescibacteria group bacterium]
MSAKQKATQILLNMLPVVVMIGLIVVVKNDYILAGIYLFIIAASLIIKYQAKDYLFFIFGFVFMIFAEILFVSTGVEEFIRNSFFGLMPIWLPVLWGYGFVVIKRVIVILNKSSWFEEIKQKILT